MDDLYGNLDNYNEEITIAELQTENKDLKCKLEEYASTLEKLQKELEHLSTEHKKLEANYSSLLLTARAEVERKTEAITKLNLEKDNLILQSLQNRKVALVNRNKSPNVRVGPGGKFDTEKMYETDSSRKSSPHMENNRKEPDNNSPKEPTNSDTDMRHKLLNMANCFTKRVDPRINQISDVKENIIQPKKENDAYKSRAMIRNRRKSMPAGSFEIERFSPDPDEITNSRISEELSRDNVDRKNTDYNFSDRPCSRISETSSLEDRHSAYHEYNAHKTREGRYDRFDKFRVRDKSSHRNKRISPDRFRKGRNDYPHYRSEHDRRRVIETPPFDKYQWSRSREPRSNYERGHPLAHSRLHRSQEKYPMKHKIQHGYGEPESKRIKIDPNYRQYEDDQRFHSERVQYEEDQRFHRKRGQYEEDQRFHSERGQYEEDQRFHNKRGQYEKDQRFQSERDSLVKKCGAEQMDNLQISSCESPDYNLPDNSTHQIKEIKFTATTKLDDPRISNKKYVVKKNDGKITLSTVEGRHVDILPVNKSVWGVPSIGMPEALMRRPQETERTVKELHMEIKTPVPDISLESGEIGDLEGLYPANHTQNVVIDNKIPKTRYVKETPLKVSDKSNNIENSLQQINSCKIPKLKKTEKESLRHKESKETAPSVKQIHKKSPRDKSKNRTHELKPLSLNPLTEKTLGEENKSNNIFIEGNNKLPLLASIDLHDKQKYASDRGVVEGDLELSDDDNVKTNHATKEIVNNLPSQNVTKESLESLNIDTVKLTLQQPKFDVVNSKCDKNENVTRKTKLAVVNTEPSKDKTTDDSKKSKNKKKSKHKDTKVENDIKIIAQTVSEKPTRKKEKVKEIKTKVIKTKFSELFDDSSSLISPEDLGLAPVLPATKVSEKNVFSEDSQDVFKLDAMKTVKDPINVDKSCNKQNKNGKATENNAVIHSAITQEHVDTTDILKPNNEEVIEKNSKNLELEIEAETEEDVVKTIGISSGIQSHAITHEHTVMTNDLKPANNEEVTENIYKNLKPEIAETEADVVKTVVISSGVQSQVSIELEHQELPILTEPRLIRTISQEIALKALATSTPNKIFQTIVVESETQAKLPDTSCNSTNSRMASVESTPALHNSDSNTLDSQTEETVVPDVRIFVRRRRKVIKKT